MDNAETMICNTIGTKNSHCIRERLQWLVAFTDPRTTWRDEPTFLFIQFSVIIGCLLNYIHARKNGGRFIHFWWATILVSLFTECLCYSMPDINNFWHGQGIVSLFGKRFPLYIVLVYNQFWYTAWITVLRANLKWWAEPFAVGVAVVLFDLPYDIMGVKMLWWTWHDTDNNIYDRHYHVPWTSYYFHSAFVTAMLFVFFGIRKLCMDTTDRFDSGHWFPECLATVLAAFATMPAGSAVFITIFYHPLHDWFGIHSEVPVLMWLGACLLITWLSDRNPTPQSRTGFSTDKLFSIPVFNVVQHYLLFTLLMFFAKPEEVKSTGLHQTIGQCNVTEETFSITGTTLLRTKFLCPDDYDEPFDFHCLPGGRPPAKGATWYTICGLPFENAMEYKFIVWFCCGMGLMVFLSILLFSGNQQGQPTKQPAASKTTTKMYDRRKLYTRPHRA